MPVFPATAFHTLCQEFHCCPWIEWIPTDAIPADSLSRIGLSIFVPTAGKMLLPAWSTFEAHDAHLAVRTKAYKPFITTPTIRPLPERASVGLEIS